MENTDNTQKVPLSIRVAPVVRQAIESLALADDRNVSNMAELLLKNCPAVQEEIERLTKSSSVGELAVAQ